jgi:hypothetical protein
VLAKGVVLKGKVAGSYHKWYVRRDRRVYKELAHLHLSTGYVFKSACV